MGRRFGGSLIERAPVEILKRFCEVSRWLCFSGEGCERLEEVGERMTPTLYK